MTKQEFVETMEFLSCAYNKRFVIDDGILAAWYEYFKPFDNKVFNDAARCFVETNSRYPSISDMLTECGKLMKQDEMEIKNTDDDEELIGDDWFD